MKLRKFCMWTIYMKISQSTVGNIYHHEWFCLNWCTHTQDNITLDNYDQVLSNVSGAVRGAATSEQEQTTSHLTVVAAAFEMSAVQLANDMTSIPNTVSYTLSL